MSTKIHHLPQSTYVDSIRFLPSLSAFDRYIILASFNSDSDQPSIQTHSLNPNPNTQSPSLSLISSFPLPSRITCLQVSQNTHQNPPLIAASTFAGSIHVLFPNPGFGFESEVSVPEKVLHNGPVSGLDWRDDGLGCVSVGEDGRVNMISVGDSGLDYTRVFDSKGLVSYSAVKWGSTVEFATGGFGNSVQWWDQRRPGGPVSQLKSNWSQGATSGIVHSIDIHQSRKHTCLIYKFILFFPQNLKAGGSYGTVFAWDLRRPQQSILLSGTDTTPCISESDVWEVQYDTFMSASNLSSERVLPAMICSEDGILAVIKQGEEPAELLAENCAINSFDIDPQNPSDVICSLEWESIALLTRT